MAECQAETILHIMQVTGFEILAFNAKTKKKNLTVGLEALHIFIFV